MLIYMRKNIFCSLIKKNAGRGLYMVPEIHNTVLLCISDGTQIFRPIVSLHHYLVRGFAPN